MYRLILYYLIGLILFSCLLSFFGLISYSIFSILFSTAVLLIISDITNTIFSKVFNAPTNVESAYVSALILALIITPLKTAADFWFLFWAAVLAMSSKYILAINKKHLFNPVAVSVLLTSLFANQSASWWVGTRWMLPAVILGGYLLARKIRREDLVENFALVAIAVTVVLGMLSGKDAFTAVSKTVLDSPVFFFAFVMLTEPLTLPPTQALWIAYSLIIGFLFAPQIHLDGYFSTPEAALVIGNIFSYLVGFKQKLFLKLGKKISISSDTYDFIFPLGKKLAYTPGQYLEWTLPHEKPDSRGNRRYFTIASSPTEDNLRLGVKFYPDSSSFKKKMLSLNPGAQIIGAQLTGDFTLPKDKKKKLAFLAGGIGITPFRSMVKYLTDRNENRNIILFYSNKNSSEIAYQDVFSEAQRVIGLKTVYTLTDKNTLPENWDGEVGRVDEAMIRVKIPDYKERMFFISGPQLMVTSYKEILQKLGLSRNQIVTDYFPGF